MQVVRFSPLGEAASYRPLTGGATAFPLAVHAWRHAFGAAFLRKELSCGHVQSTSSPSSSSSGLPCASNVATGNLVGSSSSASSGASGGSRPGLDGHVSAAMGVVRGEGKAEAAWVEWEENVCRWVFGRGLRAMGLPKR